MEKIEVLEALAALSQETRLDTFRLVVRYEPEGLPAGEIARQLQVPHNTMSTHLAILTRAGLLLSERQGRSIIYRADLAAFKGLTSYLLKDCCAGHPDVCTPLMAELACECPTPVKGA